MAFVTFIDENDYKKKERALAKYFRKQYKYLIFEIMPKLKESGKKDGLYEIEFDSDKLFKQVYGPLKLKFTVKNDVAIVEDIMPNEILLACYERDLPVYNGLPYSTNKDLKKMKIMEAILCQKKN